MHINLVENDEVDLHDKMNEENLKDKSGPNPSRATPTADGRLCIAGSAKQLANTVWVIP